ncbi:MAG: hypothetical protein V3R86_06455 [Candidatus Hydrothermarchaeaceae archaeon]
MKCYRVLYKIRGLVEIDAEDAKAALEEFDSLKVKRILETSTFENIDITEL